MTITLSSSDLAGLREASRLLATPLDHPDSDAWRSRVNAVLRPLLSADSAGFLLPAADGLLFYSDEHDADELGAYTELMPPPLSDGSTIFEKAMELGTSRLLEGWGADLPRYLSSAYYNEYAAPNGAGDTLGAFVGVPGPHAPGFATLQLWRKSAHSFSERDLVLLQLLFPSFKTGVEAHMRWSRERTGLLQALDQLGQAIVMKDAAGAVLHMTPSMLELLAADVESRIGEAVARVAEGLRQMLRSDSFVARPVSERVLTSAGKFVVQGVLYGGGESGGSPMLLIAVESPEAGALDFTLAVEAGLTPAEQRVGNLLTQNLSNAEIASRLVISVHTVKRHVERILAKLKARTRAEAAALLRR